MPTIDLSDPGQLAGLAAAAVIAFIVLVMLYRELRVRSRRYGGGDGAALVMLVAAVALVVAITPDLLPMELGMLAMFGCILLIFRPEQAVKLTGGPNLAWRTLREGRSLLLAVREAGGPAAAARDEELRDRITALGELDGPEVAPYLEALRAALLDDPAGVGHSDRVAALALADAELRATLGARPTWERELEARAAALDETERAD